MAGNVLGFTHEGDRNRELIGAAGLELTQNKLLTGTDGKGSEEVGRSGVIIPTGEQEDKPARPGATVRTTLNSDLQSIAQETIDRTVSAQHADWGVVVAMEPATGKVVVLADSNSVDPSDPSATSEENRTARSVQAVFEPGSVGKVVTFATVLEEGAVKPEDTWTVPYTLRVESGESFEDSHEHETQTMTTAGILAKSSNTGTIQIGQKVSDDVRYDYMKRFGWGQATGIEMPAESDGILYPPSSWDDRTRYATMFGHGVAGTALQSLQVLATVANKGVRVAPRVIDAWIDADGKETPQARPEEVRVVSEATAKTLTEMLIGVTQEGGTAESASINGYLVAGKTGTSEILTDDSTVASFVGFLPAATRRWPSRSSSTGLMRPTEAPLPPPSSGRWRWQPCRRSTSPPTRASWRPKPLGTEPGESGTRTSEVVYVLDERDHQHLGEVSRRCSCGTSTVEGRDRLRNYEQPRLRVGRRPTAELQWSHSHQYSERALLPGSRLS